MTRTADDKKEIRVGFDRPLRIGTRQSPLALVQAKMVANAILSAHGWRTEQVELVPMVATGDKITDRALADVGGKALWTKELDRALLTGDIDCAVHSMKDVETLRHDRLLIAAMLKRADIHDRLIGADNIDALAKSAIVGTASPRRKAQLLALRPDLDVRLIRGNVQTRLKKKEAGEYQAILLAAAGLNRLDMENLGSEISEDVMLPAPAQGAIGIECRDDEHGVRSLLQTISSRNTVIAVTAERIFLKELTADCHSPVAALAIVEGTQVYLRAQILLPDGSESIFDEINFATGQMGKPASLAQRMLGQASEELKAVFGR